MAGERAFNRWTIVVGAILIQICLGGIYAWSVFRKPLEMAIEDGGLGLTPSHATLPFSLVLIFFAIATIIGGRWQDKAGPRLVASVGGILLGVGLLLAAFGKSFPMLVIGYGVISGLGIGLAYVCPVSTGIKWFPDKRGLIAGLSVAGFGVGALILAPVARGLIDSIGIFNTLATLGAVFLVGVVASSMLLRNPPEGWVPAGWTPPAASRMTKESFSPRQMLATPQFYAIWVMYFFGCLTGLMIIGQASPIGQDLAGLSAATAAGAVMLLSIFNGTGRILWGRISDGLGRMKTLFVMFLLCGATILLCNVIEAFPPYYWIAVSVIGLCFGGYLAVFPAVTADFFGTKNIGANYGFVFTAYGVGGLLGPQFAARVLEAMGGYRLAFIVTGVLCLIAAGITFATRPPADPGMPCRECQALKKRGR
jgi:OFA family oxalate/formate antiporter-like MFS transporter